MTDVPSSLPIDHIEPSSSPEASHRSAHDELQLRGLASGHVSEQVRRQPGPEVDAAPRNRGRIAHVTWFAIVAIFSAVTLIGAYRSEQPEGRCTGIGWGCTVSGPDLAGLIAIFAGPFVVAIWLAGHAAIGLARKLRCAHRGRH